MSPLTALLRREVGLAWAGGGAPLLAAAFYAGLTALVPLASGADPERLALVAPGLAWVALALASLLSLERLFERDLEDGALDLLALGGPPLEAVTAVKAAAQWLAAGAPLSLLAPVAAVALGADPALAPRVFLVSLLGSLAFVALGAIGAALAAGSRRGGLLIAVLVLPLLVPPVIFGAGALQAGGPGGSGLALLAAYAVAAVGLSPFATAAAVRNALA